MSILKIHAFPDLVLAQKAAPVAHVGAGERELKALADDMLETMYATPGIGLAANQVGVLRRILVVDTEYDLVELDTLPDGRRVAAPAGAEVFGGHAVLGKRPRILLNPEITFREGSAIHSEGCLSVPEYSAEVKRAEKIKVTFQDIDGVTRELSAEGLMAAALQHEMDHLDGRLFIDRLSPVKRELARKKLRAERQRREAEFLGGAGSGASTLAGFRKR